MRKIYVPLILFFLIVLEGVSLELLPESIVSNQFSLVSHWVFIFLLLSAVFLDDNDQYLSVIFAVIFGLLKDIVYTDVLGIYMFAYTLTLIIFRQMMKLFQANFIMILLFSMVSLCIVDYIIYLLYIIVGKVSLVWSDYAIYRLLPTVLANILFLVVVYPLSKNRLIAWSGKD